MSAARLPAILIVEDDENDVFFLERAFQQAEVTNPRIHVHDGEEAVAYLRGDDGFADRDRYPLPGLMLLDLKMPRKNGFEVIEWVRQQPGLKRLPILVLTSSKEDPDVKRAYDLGANTYLVKPVQFEGLLEVVKALSLYWMAHAEKPSLATSRLPRAAARSPKA